MSFTCKATLFLCPLGAAKVRGTDGSVNRHPKKIVILQRQLDFAWFNLYKLLSCLDNLAETKRRLTYPSTRGASFSARAAKGARWHLSTTARLFSFADGPMANQKSTAYEKKRVNRPVPRPRSERVWWLPIGWPATRTCDFVSIV